MLPTVKWNNSIISHVFSGLKSIKTIKNLFVTNMVATW